MLSLSVVPNNAWAWVSATVIVFSTAACDKSSSTKPASSGSAQPSAPAKVNPAKANPEVELQQTLKGVLLPPKPYETDCTASDDGLTNCCAPTWPPLPRGAKVKPYARHCSLKNDPKAGSLKIEPQNFEAEALAPQGGLKELFQDGNCTVYSVEDGPLAKSVLVRDRSSSGDTVYIVTAEGWRADELAGWALPKTALKKRRILD